MKSIFAALVTVMFLGFVNQSRSEDSVGLNFKATHIRQVLQIYAETSGLELVISSEVNRLSSHIKLQPGHDLLRSEAIKLMEEAMLQQAGVVVTRLKGKRASVTYNDALPVEPLTDVSSASISRSDSSSGSKPQSTPKP